MDDPQAALGDGLLAGNRLYGQQIWKAQEI
jgi:hypothetical protein